MTSELSFFLVGEVIPSSQSCSSQPLHYELQKVKKGLNVAGNMDDQPVHPGTQARQTCRAEMFMQDLQLADARRVRLLYAGG